MTNKCILLLFIVHLIQQSGAFAQHSLTGLVMDKNTEMPLAEVNVLLLDAEGQQILQLVYTNEKGNFYLETGGPEKRMLKFTLMGYGMLEYIFDPSVQESGSSVEILLEAAPLRIGEVVIAVRKPVSVHGDTVSFVADHFRRGDERVVVDLLQRIPGLSVGSDGSIRYGNQEIEKLMVEGDDFFEKGYQMLSLTMPAFPIDQVQLLKAYSSNKILKGIKTGDKVALNLTLKKEFRSIWFGNTILGYGPIPVNRYDTRAEGMNFGKGNKHYLIGRYNNIGQRSIDMIAHLATPVNDEDLPGSGVRAFNYFKDQPIQVPDIKHARIHSNKALLTSYNSIVQLDQHWKLKLLTFLDKERFVNQKETKDQVILSDIKFDRNETQERISSGTSSYARVELQGEFSKNKTWYSRSDLYGKKASLLDKITYNQASFNEKLKSNPLKFDHHSLYSYRIRPDAALVFAFRLLFEESPQIYQFSSGAQHLEHLLGFYGFEGRYYYKISEKHQIELSAGQNIRTDRMNYGKSPVDDRFSQLESGTVAGGSYSWNFSQRTVLTVRNKLKLVNLSTRSHLSHKIKKPVKVLMDPGISIRWDSRNGYHLTGGVAWISSVPEIQDLIQKEISTGYRSAHRGTSAANIGRSSVWTLGHQYSNWNSGLFVHSLLYMLWQHKHLSLNSLIQPDFTLIEKYWVKNPFHFSAQTTIDYYLDPISSNLKVEGNASITEIKNLINGSPMGQALQYSWNSQFGIRSGFNGPFNFHVGVGNSHTGAPTYHKTYRKTNRINGFSDLYIRLGRGWEGRMQYEWYFMNQEGFGGISSSFLDSQLSYQLLAGRLKIYVVGENLLDTKIFSYKRVNEQGFSHTAYRLVPRQVLLKISVRI